MDQQEALAFSIDYHSPSEDVQAMIEDFREAAHEFANEMFLALPTTCRERSIAITHLEDCVMWVVKGMVLEDARNDLQADTVS